MSLFAVLTDKSESILLTDPAPGDSGAWVVAPTGNIVAIVVAGDVDNHLVYALPANDVFQSIWKMWSEIVKDIEDLFHTISISSPQEPERSISEYLENQQKESHSQHRPNRRKDLQLEFAKIPLNDYSSRANFIDRHWESFTQEDTSMFADLFLAETLDEGPTSGSNFQVKKSQPH